MRRRLDTLREDLASEVDDLQSLLREARDLWANICREVIAGRTEQAHGNRERAKQVIDESLLTIRDWLPVARAVTDPPTRDVAELGTTTQEAECFWAKLFDRWKTPEDLEDLVANATAPTPAQLDTITQKYGFPHVWHSATDSPV